MSGQTHSLKGIGVSPGVAVGPVRKVINIVSTDAISATPREIFEALNKEAAKHGGTAEIVEFVKYEVGEGIEKVVSDFAAEVAAQMG